MQASSARTIVIFFALAVLAPVCYGQGSTASRPPADSAAPVTGPSADTIKPYRPVGRDPFKRTIIKPTAAGGAKKGPKQVGFPALEVRRAEFQQLVARKRLADEAEPEPLLQYLVSELEIIGIFRDEQGAGAFVRAQPTGTTFFARRGAKCYNGEILRIESDEGDIAGTRVMFREKSFVELGTKQVSQERVVAKATTVPAK